VSAEPQQASLDGARVLAQFTSYSDLVAALRDRALELRVSPGCEAFSEVSGLACRHASKILSPSKPKRMGWASLEPMLQTLGTRLVLVEDQESVDRYVKRLPQISGSRMRVRSVTWTISNRKLRECGKLGGARRAENRRKVEAERASLIVMETARKEANRLRIRKHLAGLDPEERRKRWAEAKRRQRAKRAALQHHTETSLTRVLEASAVAEQPRIISG
jgi:hypothetical protein